MLVELALGLENQHVLAEATQDVNMTTTLREGLIMGSFLTFGVGEVLRFLQTANKPSKE